jgi:hypothetical protein
MCEFNSYFQDMKTNRIGDKWYGPKLPCLGFKPTKNKRINAHQFLFRKKYAIFSAVANVTHNKYGILIYAATGLNL